LLFSVVHATAYGNAATNSVAERPFGTEAILESARGEAQGNQKTIQDREELNAYTVALNTQNPAQKAAAMEAFVKQYPHSIVLIDALEQAMAAYQAAGNAAKVGETASRILALTPDNVRALAILAYLDRATATQGGPNAAEALRDACVHSRTGLLHLPGWEKPEGVDDAEFAKLRGQIADILNGAAGFCELQAKNYADARTYYLEAFRLDSTNLGDVYQLAVACLEMKPVDVSGFWYIGKAISLANSLNNAAAAQSIATYGKAKYKRYHGGEDGWDEWVAQVTKQGAPPKIIPLKPAPTPAEIAVKAVQENDPGTLSFSDWEYILSYRDASPANKEAADKVWQAIVDKQKQGKVKLRITVKVLSSAKYSIDAAITDENQRENKADLFIIMGGEIAPVLIQGMMIEVTGVLAEYRPDPFRFTMREGQIVSSSGGK